MSLPAPTVVGYVAIPAKSTPTSNIVQERITPHRDSAEEDARAYTAHHGGRAVLYKVTLTPIAVARPVEVAWEPVPE